MNVRITAEDLARLKQRGERETDGNVSELMRRLLKYAMATMPKGWND